MSILIGFLVILLIIDSIWALRVAYKEEWKKLVIAIAIGVVLDLIIIKLNDWS